MFRKSITPVCGDKAKVTLTGGTWNVEEIFPRNTSLQRTSPTGKLQTIAANIDLVLIVSSIASPPLRRGFIDRALAAAEWNLLPSVLILNKVDLSENDSSVSLEMFTSVYSKMAGYTVIQTSTVTGTGIERFKQLVSGKTVALAGVSAAGKTSLIKAIHPGIDLRVGAVNPKTTKGKHTTVSARLIRLDKTTFLIDTPGLRAFSVDHIPDNQLKLCFPEFLRVAPCKFRNCLHETEPGCSVLAAVECGLIDRDRYASYLKLLHENNRV